MQPRKFEQFLKHLAALTRRQRERLLGLLLPSAEVDRVRGKGYESQAA